MSLKVEQRLLNHQFTEFEPKIYAEGMYLILMKIDLNGIEKWVWVVELFESDVYYDGNNISANLISDDMKSMIMKS